MDRQRHARLSRDLGVTRRRRLAGELVCVVRRQAVPTSYMMMIPVSTIRHANSRRLVR
jgi:hypothetical protein